MTIVLRSTKGSALTYGEVDGNFSDLDTRTEAGWKELNTEFTARSGFNSPSFTQAIGGIYAYQFDNGVDEEVHLRFHMPKDYDAGTGIWPHIHFFTKVSSGGDVRWGYEYTWANESPDVPCIFPATQTIYSTCTVDPGSDDEHYISEVTSPIDGALILQDSIVLMRVFRNGTSGSDTLVAPVWGLSIDMHYWCVKFTGLDR